MKIILLSISLLSVNLILAQDIFGDWKTVDDDSGVEKSIVEIYKEDDQVFGKVKKILKEDERDRRCSKCEGEQKDQKIEGMVILESLSKDGEEYTDGRITDPENGKTYDAKIWLNDEDPNILMVRGYVSLFYRTQEWKRVED
ncbi:DUF2147 domain-containing protein [Psychroflexus montanilacus]|uniref:DUF2147 domain-containing protein n=1 Tax=Psychroflexus montanilacus TaxID=2873598 RepID=UPI001CCB4BFA|nr:DUF2147 domain-containing protein [Psychroflexus montanilacus]MBZ9651104.1 DUF2147 domain-containing protein [Psychroflexus montanilacus]